MASDDEKPSIIKKIFGESRQEPEPPLHKPTQEEMFGHSKPRTPEEEIAEREHLFRIMKKGSPYIVRDETGQIDQEASIKKYKESLGRKIGQFAREAEAKVGVGISKIATEHKRIYQQKKTAELKGQIARQTAEQEFQKALNKERAKQYAARKVASELAAEERRQERIRRQRQRIPDIWQLTHRNFMGDDFMPDDRDELGLNQVKIRKPKFDFGENSGLV